MSEIQNTYLMGIEALAALNIVKQIERDLKYQQAKIDEYYFFVASEYGISVLEDTSSHLFSVKKGKEQISPNFYREYDALAWLITHIAQTEN